MKEVEYKGQKHTVQKVNGIWNTRTISEKIAPMYQKIQQIINIKIMEKLKLHSITDLITNSSTTIFTYSEGSIEPCKELINEILKLMGEDKTCDDIFELSITKDNDSIRDLMDYQLEDYLEPEEYAALNIPENDYKKRNKRYDEILEEIQSGKVEEPEWYQELSEDIESDTDLNIKVKDAKYEKLAELVIKFLYSTQAIEGEN
jgi:hypothetical protein